MITFSWSDITCGLNCWYAREDVCRCSCGGKNHGCLLAPGSAQPLRTCRIDGELYYLETAGAYDAMLALSKPVNKSRGWRERDARIPDYIYHYHWRETDHGAPARLKPATAAQVDKWRELRDFIGQRNRPYLLWIRSQMPEFSTLCDLGKCPKCDDARQYLKGTNEAQPAPAITPPPPPPPPPVIQQPDQSAAPWKSPSQPQSPLAQSLFSFFG